MNAGKNRVGTIVPFGQMAQRNLPTKHESERKGLNSKKVLKRRVEVF